MSPPATLPILLTLLILIQKQISTTSFTFLNVNPLPQQTTTSLSSTNTNTHAATTRHHNVIKPIYAVTPQAVVKEGELRMDSVPNYARTGVPVEDCRGHRDGHGIEVKTAADVVGMKASCALARKVLDMAGREISEGGEGLTTDYIDKLVHSFAIQLGCYPSPLNYRGYPKSCCISVNNIICHGIPSLYALKAGDTVNVDVTVYHNGYHGDCSEMFIVGETDQKGNDLISDTYNSWIECMELCKPGLAYASIGNFIEPALKKYGYTSVRGFCGHGIGRDFHTEPSIYHHANKYDEGVMLPGHTFTIEPMVNEGSSKWSMWDDDWTVCTNDHSRSVQFEHTLLITDDGVIPLTGKTKDSPVQWWEREKGVWKGTGKEAGSIYHSN
jgi:methionyl aminopeptidase